MSDINVSSMLSIGTVLNGKYRIERHLSSGGFGNTYMATNLTFNDVVAVKEFFMRGISQRDGDSSTISVSNPENRDLFSEQLEKFKKEAQRIRQLRSQHIVRVHDLFEANGTAYYVMDYIDGESLAARLKRTNTPLTEAETRKYLGQVLDALETIHGAGLCHMDLKPENIMVDKADNAILIDFGASKRSDNERFTSTVSGVSYTNGYAPPEQLEQDTAHFGPWTDIYALGATLYKLLTNRKPPMPSAIYSDPSPDKSSSLPFPMGVSGNLRQVILQMMSVRWNDRPQSVMALRRMLVQPMYDAQTQVRPTTPYSTPASGGGTMVPGTGWPNGQAGGYGGATPRPDVKKPPTSKKKWWIVLAAVVCLAGLVCGAIMLMKKPSSLKTVAKNAQPFTVNGVSFNMVPVEGGTFVMGATSEQVGSLPDEKPAHNVTLSDFCIGETEVTQSLWKAVMGNNPSYFKGDDMPVESVSWYDCQTFISKLNEATKGQRPEGKEFRLPTEAEWEYAARGCSQHTQYAGNSNLSSVGWYNANSGNEAHAIAQKDPNELGLYDMSGNVYEWCQDWYDVDYYSKSPATNPCNNVTADTRIVRGGSWYGEATRSRVAFRSYLAPQSGLSRIGLRLALGNPISNIVQEEEKPVVVEQEENYDVYEDNGLFEDKEIAVIDGWTLKMVAVYGGSFLMGGTSEQGSDIYANEMPAHRVSLDNYYIGQTEVTQALWKAVMGYNPSVMNKGDIYPVENVSYSDCQSFVNRLNQLTEGRRPQGRDFRIPTEAEWEYAARGGQSGGYQYSGSNSVGSVAWYYNNANGKTHHVKTLGANGLGIYDMSGNVSEWTADWFDADYYSRSEEYNPCNRMQSQQRAGRGGSFASQPRNCRVSDRHYYSPNERSGHLGLRVAM